MNNVLLIVVDCLRADFVHDPRKAFIPAITKLQQTGFSFLNAIASSTTTTPSFASLLTGLYPFEHGVRSLSGYRLSTQIPTFPETMREAGYHTYAEVTGPLEKQTGFSSRFDEYRYREPEETIHTAWGNNFLAKLTDYYEQPWFVLLHVWSLHRPRVICPQCDNCLYVLNDN